MTVKWNGRNFEDALNKAAFTQLRDNVARKLRAVRCLKHGGTATSVRVSGHDLKTLQWHAEGCCDELVAAMKRSFS